jgi:hypothetical protein
MQEQTRVAQSHSDAIELLKNPVSTGSKPLPDAVAFLAQCWSELPPHVREAIITLATCCKQCNVVNEGVD